MVIDDSPDLDTEIFNMEDFQGADWVLISDEVPDRRRRARRAHAGLPGSPWLSPRRAAITRDDEIVDDDENAEPEADELEDDLGAATARARSSAAPPAQ